MKPTGKMVGIAAGLLALIAVSLLQFISIRSVGTENPAAAPIPPAASSSPSPALADESPAAPSATQPPSPNLGTPVPTSAPGRPPFAPIDTPLHSLTPTATLAPGEDDARSLIDRGANLLLQIDPKWYLPRPMSQYPDDNNEQWQRYQEGWSLIEQGVSQVAASYGDLITAGGLVDRLAGLGLTKYGSPSALSLGAPVVRSFEISNTQNLFGLSITPPERPEIGPPDSGLGSDYLLVRRGSRPVVLSWFRQPGFELGVWRTHAWWESNEERVVLACGSFSGGMEASSTRIFVFAFGEDGGSLISHSNGGGRDGGRGDVQFTVPPGAAPSIAIGYYKWAQEPFWEAHAGPHVSYVQDWKYDGKGYRLAGEAAVESPYTSLWFFIDYLRAGAIEQARLYAVNDKAISDARALGLDRPAQLEANVSDRGWSDPATSWIALESDRSRTPIAYVDFVSGEGERWLIRGFSPSPIATSGPRMGR
ncbi:MAG: hypothetical protein Q7R39_13765 [Dehalococcoidia bacterium]|nr:hypothetical protein [Dehalococcoidia bacterium]